MTGAAKGAAPARARAWSGALAEHGGVIAFYSLVAALVTFPLVLQLRHAVVGYLGLEDLQQTLWLYWWWREYTTMVRHDLPLLQGIFEFFNYPIRVGMGSFLDFIPTFLLEKLFGFPAYYNVKVLLCLVLNGWCCYCLARTLRAGAGASLVAGAVFSFNPFFATHIALGRMEQVIAFLLPLTLLFFVKAFREQRSAPAAAAGITLALACAAYWFYGIFLMMLAAILIIFNFFNKSDPLDLRRPKLWAVLVLAWGLVLAPFVIPYIVDGAKNPRKDPRLRWFEAFPAPKEIARRPNADLYQQIVNDSCSVEYPVSPVDAKSIPLAMTLFVAILVLVPGKRPWPWLASLLFFYLLSLGPWLKVKGQVVTQGGIPLIYGLFFTWLPFFTKLGWPSRAVAMVMLCLAVALALMLRPYLDRRELWRLPLAAFIALLLVALQFAGGTFPLALSPYKVPGFYAAIAGQSPGAGIIELPASSWNVDRGEPLNNLYSDVDLKNINYLQVIHGRKVLWGQAQYLKYPAYPAEGPPWCTAQYVGENTFLAYLVGLSSEKPHVTDFRKQDVEAMQKQGYRYIVVHERHGLHMPLTGNGLYERVNKRLEARIGEPVSTWVELLWETPQGKGALGLSPSEYFLAPYRIAVYDIGEAGDTR